MVYVFLHACVLAWREPATESPRQHLHGRCNPHAVDYRLTERPSRAHTAGIAWQAAGWGVEMESPTSEPTLATCDDGHAVLFAAVRDPHLLSAVAGSRPPCRHALDASLGPQAHVLLRALASLEGFWRAVWTRCVRASRVPQPVLCRRSSAAAAAGELCTSTFEYRSSAMARPYPMETLPRMHACQDTHIANDWVALPRPRRKRYSTRACACARAPCTTKCGGGGRKVLPMRR